MPKVGSVLSVARNPSNTTQITSMANRYQIDIACPSAAVAIKLRFTAPVKTLTLLKSCPLDTLKIHSEGKL